MDAPTVQDRADRHRLALAFAANVAMFVVGLAGWRLAQSTALLGDALDMLADASGYAVAWLAVGGSATRQRAAARWNGAMLMALGAALFGEVGHRAFAGGQPEGPWIAAFAALSLAVNGAVLRLLSVYRHSRQPHLRATWIDTRADVLVNAGVLVSGLLVTLTGWRAIDLVAGAVLGAFVIHEGWEIWRGDEDEDDHADDDGEDDAVRAGHPHDADDADHADHADDADHADHAGQTDHAGQAARTNHPDDARP